MILKNRTFGQMASEIAEKGKAYIFGAGMIGTVVVPEICRQNGIIQYIQGYIDNDPKRQDKTVRVGGRDIPIRSLKDVGRELAGAVLIMAISRFQAVIDQLENLDSTVNTVCYLFPMMCISNFQTPQIPKVIHYMWLGGRELPDTLKKCMESWYRFCPDYKIKRWDESNYDLDKNIYMRNAYRAGKYGFVPDYARLDILYEHGGIYMDTDVELLRPLDDLLGQEAFCGVEKWQTVNFGGCSGAVKGSRAVKIFLEARESLTFYDRNGNLDTNTCGYYDTLTAMRHGYEINGCRQTIAGITIYPADFFHPYDYMSGELNITCNTHSIHHFNGGWLDENMREENKRAQESYRRLRAVADR